MMTHAYPDGNAMLGVREELARSAVTPSVLQHLRPLCDLDHILERLPPTRGFLGRT